MRINARHILAAVLALLTGLLGAPGTAVAQIASTYTVTDLGNFFATGVNDSSWVSGYDGRALVWRPGLGTHEILGGGRPTPSTTPVKSPASPGIRISPVSAPSAGPHPVAWST